MTGDLPITGWLIGETDDFPITGWLIGEAARSLAVRNDNPLRLVRVEPVDDLPVPWAQIQKTQIPALLDQVFPIHGLWKGASSFGEVAGVGLLFVTSQGDHGLAHVQSWAAERLATLGACVGKPIRPLDFSDDRLAEMLDRWADPDPWAAVEPGLNEVAPQVYDLDAAAGPICIDSTSTKAHAPVDENGLFQWGHGKDHRPDLPRSKISLSPLDPLGLPLTTTVVGGNCADPRQCPVAATATGRPERESDGGA